MTHNNTALNWNDLRYVLAVARNDTVAGAARFLGVDATTVTRRLRVAEEVLSARLFDRDSDGKLSPTEVGTAALRYAERAEFEIEGLVDSINGADTEPTGTVRMTAVPILIGRVLLPAISELMSRYPSLSLEVLAEPRDLNLMRREVDIALRLARPTLDAGRPVITRCIGTLNYAVFVPTDCSAADEQHLPWIGYEEHKASLPQAKWMAIASAKTSGSSQIALNDAESVLQAIRSGLGRSLLPRILGNQTEGLRQSLPPDGLPPLPTREIWLLVHPDLRSQTRVQVVMKWLETAMGTLSEA